MKNPALKAGLIGGLILIGLNVIGLVGMVGCVTLILEPFVYAGIGALAAHFMLPRRQPGAGAGVGALAAVIAALIGGLTRTVITTLQLALTDSAAILSQLPADSLDQLRDAGIDPAMFTGPGMGVAVGSVCCVLGLAIGAALGALGGLLYAAARPE